MSNMQVGWLLGSLLLFVLFRKKIIRNLGSSPQALPISQNWDSSPYKGLLPYIHAQAIHESGNFTSRLANEQNNLFGMKVPLLRKFAGFKVQGSEFAGYPSFRASVEDLMLWMDATGFPKVVSGSAEYVQELKRRKYFEDNISTYLKGLNSGLSQLDPGETFKITYF